jgi:hypothetical protein
MLQLLVDKQKSLQIMYNAICKNISSDNVIIKTMIGFVNVDDLLALQKFVEINQSIINSKKSVLSKVLYEAVLLQRKEIIGYLKTLDSPEVLSIIAYAKHSMDDLLIEKEQTIEYVNQYLQDHPYGYNLVFQGIIQCDDLSKIKNFLHKHYQYINPDKLYLWVVSASFEVLKYLLYFYFETNNDSPMGFTMVNQKRKYEILSLALESAINNRRRSIVKLLLEYVNKEDQQNILKPLLNNKVYLPLKDHIIRKYFE